MNKTLTLGAAKFAIGAMNLGQLERAMPIIQTLRLDDGIPQITKLLDIVQIGVSVAYPDVDIRLETSTLAELKDALTAIMEVSGFETKADAPGEAPARVTARRSTSKRSAKS